MKKLFYRFASSRSFTRLFSILTFAVVAFAALELLFVQPALAGKVCCAKKSDGSTDLNVCTCDPSVTPCDVRATNPVTGLSILYNAGPIKDPLTGFDKSCNGTIKFGSASQIKSKITCVNADGNGTTVVDPSSFTQSGLLFCEVTESSHDDIGFCQYNLQYFKPGLRTCVNNNGTSTATWNGLCTDVSGGPPGSQLTVTGTLKCGLTEQQLGATIQPPAPGSNCLTSGDGSCGLPLFCDGHQDCILNLGVAEEQGKCSDLFPAGTALDPQVPGLLEDQVLVFSQTVQGPNCSPDTQILAIGLLETVRYCSSGTFANAPGDPVDCTPQGQEPLTGLGLAQSAIPIDVTFPTPTKLNLNCGPNNNDTWTFVVSANQHLPNLNQIVVSTLAVEGVGAAGPNNTPPSEVTCDPVKTNVVPNTRTCHINACQTDQNLVDLGPVACANRNPDGTVNLTVTGELSNGIAIFGEHKSKKTTGNCS